MTELISIRKVEFVHFTGPLFVKCEIHQLTAYSFSRRGVGECCRCHISVSWFLSFVYRRFVSDEVSFKKQHAGRSDYGFHSYMEPSQFVFCLLSRSRERSSLPWDRHIGILGRLYGRIKTPWFRKSVDVRVFG